MYRLDSCISNEDLVKPLHKIHFLKNLLFPTYSIQCIFEKKIRFDLLVMFQKNLQWLYSVLNFLKLILELYLS